MFVVVLALSVVTLTVVTIKMDGDRWVVEESNLVLACYRFGLIGRSAYSKPIFTASEAEAMIERGLSDGRKEGSMNAFEVIDLMLENGVLAWTSKDRRCELLMALSLKENDFKGE